VGALMPNTVVKVAESGVRGPDDAQVLVDAGFDAILVGESLVTAQDIAAAVTAMRSEPTTTLQ
jgi:indole-3-glycerol phosphate synthase